MSDKDLIAIREDFSLDADASDVWRLIQDPKLVAECVPGATLTESGDDGHHKGVIKVKFGPTLVSFRGEATVRYDDESKICTIESRGSDQRGTSRARAEGKVTIGGTRPAEVHVEGAFQVSGALGSFARTGGVHLARELLAEFAKNLSARLKHGEQPAAGEPPPRAEASISGGTLMLRVMKEWLRSLFGRANKA